MLGWNKGDIAPHGEGDTLPASREHSNEGWASGWPLRWAAGANQASLSHCLAWQQGFQKHMFLVNKPKEKKTSLEANKGTPSVSQAHQGAGTWRSEPGQRGATAAGVTTLALAGEQAQPARRWSRDMDVGSPWDAVLATLLPAHCANFGKAPLLPGPHLALLLCTIRRLF